MKRRGFFGAALAGVVGAVVAVKGQRAAQVNPPDDVPGPIQADLTAEERAAFREAWEYWSHPPMIIRQFAPTTTGGANTTGMNFGGVTTISLGPSDKVEYLGFPGLTVSGGSPYPPTILAKYPHGDGPV